MRFLVWDSGLSTEHAVRLARDNHKVFYFTHYQKTFPKFADFSVGLGLEGIEKILYPGDYIDQVDAIIFFDIGAGDITSYLRKKGYTVYGAGEGEKLENHRSLLKRIQKDINLPSQKWEEVQGLTNLRNYLRENKDKWVKIDIFRGDIESFYSKNYNSVELYLNEIGEVLGPFSETYTFIVEDKVEGIEPGFDLFFNGTDYLKPYLWGFEHSKTCYIGRYSSELPAPLKLLADKFKPILQQLDYRGAISMEAMVTPKGVPYLIDFTARYPFPLSAIYTESIRNYSDVIYKIAQKLPVDLDVAGKYVAALPLESSHADTHWVKIDFDKKLRNRVKFRLASSIGGKYYAVKGLSTVVVLIAIGDSPQHLIEELEVLSEEVDAFGINKDAIGNLHKIHEIIRESDKYNLSFIK